MRKREALKTPIANTCGRDACEAAREASEISKARKKQGNTVRDGRQATKELRPSRDEAVGARNLTFPSIATDAILARPRFTTALAGDQSFACGVFAAYTVVRVRRALLHCRRPPAGTNTRIAGLGLLRVNMPWAAGCKRRFVEAMVRH